MPPHTTTLLLALLITVSAATASTHRTLNLLRGSEVANRAEAGIDEVKNVKQKVYSHIPLLTGNPLSLCKQSNRYEIR